MRLIIDADPIVYRSGFAAEAHDYHIVYDGPDGEVHEAYFAGSHDKKGRWVHAGDKLKKWLADPKKGGHEQVSILSKEKVVRPEPKENALHLVSEQMRGIIHATEQKFGKLDNPQISILLSGPGNFREKLATLKPYKGNRDTAHKPHWYQAIRDYLTGTFGARVVKGREADDECSIIGHNCWERDEKFVVATIDKDLDQVPGWHYDYRRKVFYQVNQFQAERRFWEQTLSGDATDNIGGCYKIGEEKAEQIVRDVIDKAADDVWPTPTEFWGRVVLEYTLSLGKKGCPYADKDANAVALENARLVYMQKKPRELWVPPGHEPAWLEDGDDDE